MKTEFTREFMTSNRSCYSRDEMLNVKCVKDNNITLENLFNDLPIKDFCWFFIRKSELTTEQKQRFALHCAKSVLHIYEKEYPNDNRVRECLEVNELYLDGKATIEDLILKRNDSDDVVDADVAVYSAAAASDAAATVYSSSAVYSAAAYSADADAADADAAYSAFRETVWDFVCNQ